MNTVMVKDLLSKTVTSYCISINIIVTDCHLNNIDHEIYIYINLGIFPLFFAINVLHANAMTAFLDTNCLMLKFVCRLGNWKIKYIFHKQTDCQTEK